MDTSDWISLSALAVSVTALIYSIRNGATKANISILEMRNSFRVNVHESTIEVLLLIEKIKNQATSDRDVRIIEKLIETAEGMASMYETLKKNIEVPWYVSSSTFIAGYNRFASDLKEFNLLLSEAKAEFNKRNIDKLEKIVAGLRVRMVDSKDIVK